MLEYDGPVPCLLNPRKDCDQCPHRLFNVLKIASEWGPPYIALGAQAIHEQALELSTFERIIHINMQISKLCGKIDITTCPSVEVEQYD